MEKHDARLYLDRNEHNYGPAPIVYDILKSVDKDLLGFYSREFDKGIKSSLSKFIGECFDIPEKRVLLGYGGEDLLKQVVHGYLAGASNNTLLIPQYSWWYYKQIAGEVGGNTEEYPMQIGTDSFLYDLDGMKETYKKYNPKMVLIASPNNPTGNTISGKLLREFLEFVNKDTIVVIDEAYAMYQTTDYKPVKELVDSYPNLIVIRTFSKYYGLPAVRIGFALVSENLESIIQSSTRYLGYNRISEEMAIAVMKETDYYESISHKMAEDKLMFKTELEQIPGWKVYESNANFILVEIPEQVKNSLKRYLVDRNIIVKFMNEDGLHNHLRVTLGTQEQNRLLVDNIKAYYAESAKTKAVILAAGMASRLRPLTNDTPKCLLEVGGKKILQRSVDNIIANGITDIIVVTGYLKEMIESYLLENYPQVNFTFLHNEKYDCTNNIYSLWMCKEVLGSGKVLLLDSDIVFEEQIISRLMKSGYENCLALNDHELGEEEIKVIVDNQNQITEISKVCSISNSIGESIGIELFNQDFLKDLYAEMDQMILEEGLDNVFYELAFERIIQKGQAVSPVDTTDLFSMEIDTVEDYKEVSESFVMA
jgi:histidinol-phosphate aminotransferase